MTKKAYKIIIMQRLKPSQTANTVSGCYWPASKMPLFGPMTRENLSSGVRKPVCASRQFDQRHCCLLIGKYHI